MRNLNNLQTALHAIQLFRRQTRRRQACRQRRFARFFQTERSISSLIEAIYKRNVERGDVRADAQVLCSQGQLPTFSSNSADIVHTT
jgi:hypothetical protein